MDAAEWRDALVKAAKSAAEPAAPLVDSAPLFDPFAQLAGAPSVAAPAARPRVLPPSHTIPTQVTVTGTGGAKRVETDLLGGLSGGAQKDLLGEFVEYNPYIDPIPVFDQQAVAAARQLAASGRHVSEFFAQHVSVKLEVKSKVRDSIACYARERTSSVCPRP